MPEIRSDPVTQRQVIIAPSRASRPGAFVALHPPDKPQSRDSCPFCPGHEDETPPAVLTYPDHAADRTDWQLRVVTNLFPALAPDRKPTGREHDFFASWPGRGRHEVVIDAPEHVGSLTELSPDQVSLLFRAYADRLRLWRDERFGKQAIVFKNTGVAAGASLYHSHSQMIALPHVPSFLAAELRGARDFFAREGKCVFCEMVRREQAEQVRVVEQHDQYLVFCPFASRVPYEMWIVPVMHADHFDRCDNSALDTLGRLVRSTLVRLENLIEGVAYNYLIHTAPFDTRDYHHYHWHIEIVPRTTREAGFEWGTGCGINPLSPEKAAQRLRSA